jgi:hypothetical protein
MIDRKAAEGSLGFERLSACLLANKKIREHEW